MSKPAGEQVGLTKAGQAAETAARVGVIAKVIAAGGSYSFNKKKLTLRMSLQLTLARETRFLWTLGRARSARF